MLALYFVTDSGLGIGWGVVILFIYISSLSNWYWVFKKQVFKKIFNNHLSSHCVIALGTASAKEFLQGRPSNCRPGIAACDSTTWCLWLSAPNWPPPLQSLVIPIKFIDFLWLPLLLPSLSSRAPLQSFSKSNFLKVWWRVYSVNPPRV